MDCMDHLNVRTKHDELDECMAR